MSREKWVYLLCDNGYLQWSQHICPYMVDEPCLTEAGFFSSNIESVRKDDECTFGILKKRWWIFNNGLQFRDIGDCNKIFIMCCCPHNYLLDIVEQNDVRIGQGHPFDGDGIWMDGHTDPPSDKSDRLLLFKFAHRRFILAKQLYVSRDKDIN